MGDPSVIASDLAAPTDLDPAGWDAIAALTGGIPPEQIDELRAVPTVTDAGRWAFDILAFLHKRVGEAELLPTVAGLDYALQIGVDPVRHLLSMRARLNALRAEIDWARASHSEVVLRRTARRIEDALKLSAQIRAALDRVPLDHVSARAVAREIHGLLALLHGAGSELHRDVTEVGRQYLTLTGGLTTEQIVRALISRSRDELAGVARDALLPVVTPPPLVTTDVLGSAAEQQALRERPEAEEIAWNEPAPAPRASAEEVAPADVRALIADLSAVVKDGRALPLVDAVAHRSRAESFLREPSPARSSASSSTRTSVPRSSGGSPASGSPSRRARTPSTSGSGSRPT